MHFSECRVDCKEINLLRCHNFAIVAEILWHTSNESNELVVNEIFDKLFVFFW